VPIEGDMRRQLIAEFGNDSAPIVSVRGADDGIKAGVKRSETPGSSSRKFRRAREAAE
jgi:hypothetical protein